MIIQGGNRFFFEFDELEGFLSEEESWHVVKVLRKKIKDRIHLIDGKGKEFEGEIVEIQKKGKKFKVRVRILGILREEKKALKRFLAFIPLLKGDKTEFLIEKGTELGIDVFIPFLSKHTVVNPSDKILIRLKTKALQALKQCGRLYMPEVMKPVKLFPFVEEFVKTHENLNLLKILGTMFNQPFQKFEIIEKLKKSSQVVIISGPEGGFSKEEERKLLELGFFPLDLSPYILRAETASFALMSLVCFFKNLENFKKD